MQRLLPITSDPTRTAPIGAEWEVTSPVPEFFAVLEFR